MRLKVRFFQHFHRANRAGQVHIYKRPYLLPVVGLLLGVVIVIGLTAFRSQASLRPSGSRVVFLFDGGKKTTLDTQAKTVGELVKRLPLKLIPEDVVEPSADTEIVQDNFRINVYRARPVTIVDNGVKSVTITAQKSPRVVAASAGVQVFPEDYANFQQGDIKNNTIGEEVVINRATPIGLNLYGTQETVRTRSQTVADLLKEKNVTLTKDDTLTPSPSTPITEGLQVSVVRNGTQVITVEEAVDPPVQYVDDSSLSLGATAIRQAGTPGKKAVTYQTITQNGQVVSKTAIQQVNITDPVPTIIARGTVVYVNGDKTSMMAAAGISSGDYGYVDFIVSHESGWRTTAMNPSGAYGLCQSLPGSKMASAGGDWATNPITQLRWCNSYANSTYGGWAGAYSFWVSRRYW